ncbi:UPF0052-domain-containing protein [Rhizoclosmatium globosum]|uniref:UPF0052-domain-containing protein n=1 Tax=Rhizoclosmatium globosum TaxID=329046 RepID=A0A1Y2C9Z6_9FUNG|nr:UPF0052-domain-containing protein [Rhizoclosmatium globosum]|eukprot:ORY43717.1 UPF0052-domain-containing protein [Rhizoclosmatium globosum]
MTTPLFSSVSTLSGLVRDINLKDGPGTPKPRSQTTSAETLVAYTEHRKPSILVFSGGSAVSSFVPMFQSITDDVCYVMPVSDDGGSTFEIVKVMGGPAIGDIRSRILGLADTSSPEGMAVYKLLSHRLPANSSPNQYSSGNCQAKSEWMSILEGNHILWNDIPLPHQYTIRSFLFQFQDHLLKETAGFNIISNGQRKQTFDFRGGCIGNFFISGCRLFFHSLEAGIFQFSKLVGCPNKTLVLPIIATNHHPVSIAVNLRNGTTIHGQCEISHPGITTTIPTAPTVTKRPSSVASFTNPTPRRAIFEIPSSTSLSATPVDTIDYSTSTTASAAPRRIKRPPSSASTSSLKKFNLGSSLDFAPLHWTKSSGSLSSSSNLFFTKSHTDIPPLPSPIRRVYYTDQTGTESLVRVNDLIPRQLEKRTIVYGVGSLYTSLLPCLVVPGVASLIAQDWEDGDGGGGGIRRNKVLLLNGTHDRETEGYTAMDFLLAVVDALNCGVLGERGEGGVGAVEKVLKKRDVATDMEGGEQVWRWRGALVGTGVGMRRRGSDVSGELFPASVGSTEGDEGDDFDDADEDIEEDEEVREMSSPAGRSYLVTPYPPSAYVTHLLYAEDSQVAVEVDDIEALGIKCVMVRKSGSLANAKNVVDESLKHVERGSHVNVSTLSSRTPGHFGPEELKLAIEPLL